MCGKTVSSRSLFSGGISCQVVSRSPGILEEINSDYEVLPLAKFEERGDRVCCEMLGLSMDKRRV